jgi:predicted hydrocarbon binding protein
VQQLLKELKVGILSVEKSDVENMNFTLTVSEDLDCSGLPIMEEAICIYDEGVIAGILETYTGLALDVQEVDCWCTGDRVCRFKAVRMPEQERTPALTAVHCDA